MIVSPRGHSMLSRLTYANVVATIALLVAVGTGSAFALTITGSQIKDSTVTTKDLKDLTVGSRDLATSAVTAAKLASNAVTAAKLATNAVSSAKIADGAIVSADLADKSVTRAKIADGAISTGQLDALTTFAFQNVTSVVTGDGVSVDAQKTLTAICTNPAHVTGGGARSTTPNLVISGSYPVGTNQWAVEVSPTGAGTAPFVTPYAVCI